jgi:hypothetical protein
MHECSTEEGRAYHADDAPHDAAAVAVPAAVAIPHAVAMAVAHAAAHEHAAAVHVWVCAAAAVVVDDGRAPALHRGPAGGGVPLLVLRRRLLVLRLRLILRLVRADGPQLMRAADDEGCCGCGGDSSAWRFFAGQLS